MGVIYFLLFGPAIGGVLGLIIGLIIKCMGYDSGSCYCGGSLSSMETEMKNHNAWMEQMMQEQQRITFEDNAQMAGRRLEALVEGELEEDEDGRIVYAARSYRDAPDVDGQRSAAQFH